jgi:hypothetical protein
VAGAVISPDAWRARATRRDHFGGEPASQGVAGVRRGNPAYRIDVAADGVGRLRRNVVVRTALDS